MTQFVFGLVVGLLAGGFVGVITMALMNAAHERRRYDGEED